MVRSRMRGAGPVRPARWAVAAAGTLVALIACGGARVVEDFRPRAGGPYRPGESIAAARLCSCSVCEKRSCCEGDDSLNPAVEPEFGLELGAPCACVRRVWTARGEEPCAALAGPDCCPGSVSD